MSLSEFPELIESAKSVSSRIRSLQSEEAKFDAEIDRLCNLGALEHIKRKRKREKPSDIKSSEKSTGTWDLNTGLKKYRNHLINRFLLVS